MSDDPFFRRDMTIGRARQLLGLARDADARAVRRAYADALRALDVDADPAGFADLRDARALALAEARRRADAAPVTLADEGPTPAPTASATAPDDPTPRAPATPSVTPDSIRGPSLHEPPSRYSRPAGPADERSPGRARGDGEREPTPRDPAALDHHRQALTALLIPDGQSRPYLLGGEQATAATHLDALLADPALRTPDGRAAAETWFADLLTAAGARADYVIPAIVAVFGWASDPDAQRFPGRAALVGRAAELTASGPEEATDEALARFGDDPARAPIDDAAADWWRTGQVPPDPADRTAVDDAVAEREPPPPIPAALSGPDLGTELAGFEALLLPPGEAAESLTPGEAAAAHAHLDRLLADPRLDGIEFREQAGIWYAEVAATAGSRADAVLPRLVAFFGWERDRDRFDQHPAQAWALERADILAAWAAEDAAVAEYRHQLDQPYHYYHRAWRDLTERRGILARLLPRSLPRTRADLIEMLRVEQPRLHAEVMAVQPKWVSWVRTAAGVIVAVLLMQLAVTIEGLGRDGSPGGGATPATVVAQPPPIADDLTTPERDIEPILVGFGGGALNIPALAVANPVWLADLRQRWADAWAAKTPRSTFATDLYKEVATRYRAAFRRAAYDQVARGRRLERDRLVYARDRFGTLACGDLVAGEPVPEMIDRRFRDERQALAGEVLLTMRGIPAERVSKRFSMPMSLYRAAARRADLSPEEFGRAIDREGTSEAGCAAWIALYDEALAAPPATGLKLLREM